MLGYEPDLPDEFKDLCSLWLSQPDRQPFTHGPYDRIAKKLFNDLHFDRFYVSLATSLLLHSVSTLMMTTYRIQLEYDTKFAGTFDPLRYLPKGKHVVLGLVSTKTAEVRAFGPVAA